MIQQNCYDAKFYGFSMNAAWFLCCKWCFSMVIYSCVASKFVVFPVFSTACYNFSTNIEAINKKWKVFVNMSLKLFYRQISMLKICIKNKKILEYLSLIINTLKSTFFFFFFFYNQKITVTFLLINNR